MEYIHSRSIYACFFINKVYMHEYRRIIDCLIIQNHPYILLRSHAFSKKLIYGFPSSYMVGLFRNLFYRIFFKKKTLWNQLFNSQIIAIQTQFHRSMSDKEPAGESVQYNRLRFDAYIQSTRLHLRHVCCYVFLPLTLGYLARIRSLTTLPTYVDVISSHCMAPNTCSFISCRGDAMIIIISLHTLHACMQMCVAAVMLRPLATSLILHPL